MLMAHSPLSVALLLLLTAAVAIDVRRHRIPNTLSFGGAALGLGLQGWVAGANGLLAGAGGLGVGLIIFLPFFLARGMGAGDVKLMAAVGTFLGPANTLLAAGLSLIVGGMLAVLVLVVHGELLSTLCRYGAMVKTLIYSHTWCYVPPGSGEAAAMRMPYAVAIASGTLAALWRLSESGRLVPMGGS